MSTQSSRLLTHNKSKLRNIEVLMCLEDLRKFSIRQIFILLAWCRLILCATCFAL